MEDLLKEGPAVYNSILDSTGKPRRAIHYPGSPTLSSPTISHFFREVQLKMAQHRERPLQVIRLDNGLELTFYDRSRTIAGDRKQVQLLARIPVRVEPSHFRLISDPAATYRRFVDAFGDTIYFEEKKIRNFIDDKEVPKVLKQLQEDFIRINRRYLSHPEFATRFIRRRYDDWQHQLRYQVY